MLELPTIDLQNCANYSAPYEKAGFQRNFRPKNSSISRKSSMPPNTMAINRLIAE
ncbi:hypothetical protein [Undibacterium sp.]|uniref:hypothetical protein n=1 Tax=Undibacterium sp. TaxID=1914977 RepID=UPI00272967A3|nr:hypothetical protein [Undibacterium sp.]